LQDAAVVQWCSALLPATSLQSTRQPASTSSRATSMWRHPPGRSRCGPGCSLEAAARGDSRAHSLIAIVPCRASLN
jgi:hypothetical protein